MNAALVSIIFTTFAACVAFVAAPRKGAYEPLRILIYWVVAAAVAFLIPYKLLGLVVLGGAMLALAPGAPVKRVAFFIAIFAALPDYYRAQIPFPGLNYLVELDHAKIATLLVLGPVFAAKAFQPTGKTLRIVDQMLLLYVLMTGFMSIRDLPFTSMLRVLLDQFLLIYVPYIAISRSLKSQADIENLIRAFFTGLVMIAVIGLVSIAVKWNYYVSLDPAPMFKVYTEFRNGLLRIYSTVNTTLLGFLMGAGLVSALFLRHIKAHPGYYIIGLAALFALVAFATGSRGGWLAAMLAIVAYAVFLNAGGGLRRLFVFSLAAGAVVFGFMVFQGGDVTDQFGTYSYRAEFLRTSIPQIMNRPLFGSSNFMELPSFERLRQGEGIIDLVNAYLQVTLFYGLTGLALFLGSYLAVFKAGLGALKVLPKKREADGETASARRTLSLLLALLLAYLAMLATVSGVSYIWNVGFLTLAVLTAQVRLCESLQAAPVAAEAPAPLRDEQQKNNAPTVPAQMPYGARFVRRPER